MSMGLLAKHPEHICCQRLLWTHARLASTTGLILGLWLPCLLKSHGRLASLALLIAGAVLPGRYAHEVAKAAHQMSQLMGELYRASALLNRKQAGWLGGRRMHAHRHTFHCLQVLVYVSGRMQNQKRTEEALLSAHAMEVPAGCTRIVYLVDPVRWVPPPQHPCSFF